MRYWLQRAKSNGVIILAILSVGIFTTAVRAENRVNRIIRDLAPIEGQINSGGYNTKNARPAKSKRAPRKVKGRTIFVDITKSALLEVYFPFDSARITRRAQGVLNDLGKALNSKQLSRLSYLIEGHTDAVGSASYNLELSRARAAAIRAYLIRSFEIDPRRLLSEGFGFYRLKRPEAPRAAINRRVEVFLIIDGNN